jgi:hypothetical protein
VQEGDVRSKCTHGYFDDQFQHCPWCHGFDDSNRDAVPVVGHGNGWLLRQGDPACPSCGGPRDAGWGLVGDGIGPAPMCYVCTIGDNTVEAIAKRAAHESTRGVRKIRGMK